ncbi:unnamed protein product [Prunus brigantina]
MVGGLQYLTLSRPDITFAMNQLCQFMHHPSFSDSDWAGSIDDRRSITGACVFLGPNLLTWTTKKQSTVSRSSSEAEYCALATTATELRWFGYLFRKLDIPLRSPPCIFVNNISVLHMATNPVFHDYHFVRELISQGVL